MLRRLLSPTRVGLLIAMVTAAVLAGMVAPSIASAETRCTWQAVRNPDGSISYVKKCVDVDPGSPGGPGGSGPIDTCDLDKQQEMAGYSAFYCVGRAACTIKDNWVPYAPPTETAPPGHEWKLQLCWPCGGCFGPPVPTYILDGPPARPLIVQAQEAFGRLRTRTGVVQHSPKVNGIVRLDTWFWMDPVTFNRLTGTSAEGLVAVADPDQTVWDTGDGATVTCKGPGTEYAEGRAPTCTHTYTKASPQYDGNVTRIWAVHYENGGAPIDIPGAPDTLTADTPWTLAVAEAQVLSGQTPGR
ncbi:MAG TPA: hypothetical protein VGP36_08720 [Mycobacteriales bacterium]|jgi:hypothetical protein|nr:hypothetical protein [Mycobacteriales bacterium]